MLLISLLLNISSFTLFNCSVLLKLEQDEISTVEMLFNGLQSAMSLQLIIFITEIPSKFFKANPFQHSIVRLRNRCLLGRAKGSVTSRSVRSRNEGGKPLEKYSGKEQK